MADIVDQATRSKMMAGIKGKNTMPELALRQALHALGFRYRLHAKHVAGRPDMLLPKFGAVVFVHGCFWHRHASCRYCSTPSTRPDFWATKFSANRARDAKVQTALLESGWRVAIVWECALRKPEMAAKTAKLIQAWLNSRVSRIEIGERELGIASIGGERRDV